MLWAVAMPCWDYTVCAEPGPTLTFSDTPTVSETVEHVWDSWSMGWIRDVLLDAGVLDDPTRQCVEVFKQYCPNGCRSLPSDVTATLSFEVCGCPPGEEMCTQLIDPDVFINTIGLGGLVTFVDDLENDPPSDPVLDYGSTFTLQPPTVVPTVSEWGLVIMTLLLLGGLTIRFARLGRRPEASSHRS